MSAISWQYSSSLTDVTLRCYSTVPIGHVTILHLCIPTSIYKKCPCILWLCWRAVTFIWKRKEHLKKGTLPNPLASYIRHLIHAGCYLDNEWSKCSQEMFLQPKSQPWSTKEFCISSTVSSNDWLQNFLFLLIWKCTFWAFHVQLYTT